MKKKVVEFVLLGKSNDGTIAQNTNCLCWPWTHRLTQKLHWRNRAVVFRKLHIVIEFDWQIKVHFFSRQKCLFQCLYVLFSKYQAEIRHSHLKGIAQFLKCNGILSILPICHGLFATILDQLDLTPSNGNGVYHHKKKEAMQLSSAKTRLHVLFTVRDVRL